MNLQEAQAAIGQPFKWKFATGDGLAAKFDIIRSVDPDGTIHGDFIEAHCEDCRFKQEQPEHLKKHTDTKIEQENATDNDIRQETEGSDC